MPIHAPKIGVFGGFCPQNGEQYERDPEKAHPWAETRRMTYRSSKSVHICALGASRRIKQKKIKKGIPKKPQHVFFHVFAQTTHIVAAPHGFACVVIPATRLYIPSFIEIRSGVSEPQGVKIWHFPLLWLVAFTTACTTVQAVMKLQMKHNKPTDTKNNSMHIKRVHYEVILQP